MKTANKDIQIFRTFEKAESYFKNLNCSASFVQAKGICTDYFVDKNPNENERCHKVWPDKYDFITGK